MSYTTLVLPRDVNDGQAADQVRNVNDRQAANQVQNYSGAYVYQVTPLEMLRRFLILGSDKNTYYVGERELTQQNIENFKNLALSLNSSIDAVNLIVEVSESGAAPTNNHAVFALAYFGANGDITVRRLVASVMPRVVRTGSDLFTFVEYSQLFRGWGNVLKKAVTKWYMDKSIDRMAFQMVKYQQRNGFSHRDLLRLSHIRPDNDMRSAAFEWALGKDVDTTRLPAIMSAYESVKAAKTEQEIVRLIEQYNLTHEFVPRDWHGSKAVWQALLPNLPPGAMLRNLARLTSLGLLRDFDNIQIVENTLTNPDRLRKARLHPIEIADVSMLYRRGYGNYDNIRWTPTSRIVSILHDGFYAAFGALEPHNKRIMVALDVSGSMRFSNIGNTSMTPAAASAIMAMAYVRSEKNVMVTAFTNGIRELDISTYDSLDTVQRKINALNFSATDCSLPMSFAEKNRIGLDAFITFTDNETNVGQPPMTTLRSYRQSEIGNPNAVMVVNAMLASSFTIADPDDPYCLDVVGFDSTVPAMIGNLLQKG